MSTDRRCETCAKWSLRANLGTICQGWCRRGEKDATWTWSDAVCPDWQRREDKWLKAAREWWREPGCPGAVRYCDVEKLADHFRKVAEEE